MTRLPILTFVSLVIAVTILFTTTVVDAAPPKEIEACGGTLPLVFTDDFEDGADSWEPTDANAWKLFDEEDGKAYGLTQRVSKYKPPHRSPHNISLIKDVKVADFVLTFRVKSTLDTGGHRDACVFFNYQDPANFYYVHMGARPDPHSGQIMIVDDAPRKAMTQNKNQVPWDDEWHQVKVVRCTADGSIKIYFDDMETPIMEATNKEFGAGRIGIGSFDDMNNYDDVVLYGK